MKFIFTRISTWLSFDKTPPEIKRARQLISAIDSGGIPLNPAKVRQIAEDLGLEVSRKAKAEDTIKRIRAALARHSD